MIRVYPALAMLPLRGGATFHQPFQPGDRVRLNSPALSVMTDLQSVPAATIDPEAPIDAANRFMIRRGVRLLLITDERHAVLGLVTTTDILGEKPIRFALERRVPRQDIRVRDIMTPHEQLQVLDREDVARSEVGHIVATLKSVGRQHALVADCGPDRKGASIRGIFSLSQIARQLGVAIQSTEVAQTFADIEAVLRS